jgi:hypothetical protein
MFFELVVKFGHWMTPSKVPVGKIIHAIVDNYAARRLTFAGPPKAAPTMNGRRRTLNPPVGPFTVKFLDAGRQVTRRDAQQRIKVSRRVFRAVIDSDQGFRRKLGLSNGGITP